MYVCFVISLSLVRVKEKTGTLSDGRIITARPGNGEGCPTLEIRSLNGAIRGDSMIKLYETLEKSDEKILLLAIVGSLEAIQKNAMTIDDAEIFLFSPRMVSNLKQKKCNEKIISLIERGCELENIESLIPEDFHEEIINMIDEALELIKNYEAFGSTFLNFPSANYK